MSSSYPIGTYSSPFQQKISSAKSEIVNGERSVTVNFTPYTQPQREYLIQIAAEKQHFDSQMGSIDAQIKKLALERMRMTNEMFDSFQKSHEFLGFAVSEINYHLKNFLSTKKEAESGTLRYFQAFVEGFLEFKEQYAKFLKENDPDHLKEFEDKYKRQYLGVRDRFANQFYYTS